MSDVTRQPAPAEGDAEGTRVAGPAEAEATRIDDPELRSAFGLDGDEATWLGMLKRSRETVPLGSLGPYELLAEAGRGAQGTVYKAEHRRTKRVVALKRLPLAGAASARARARFEREIEAACALDHPAVVRVYSAEVLDGHAVIAMEWVEGRGIDHWARDGARRIEELVSLFVQVCEGVAHAHQRGVIHRDLKPSNIMVGADGRPRVLDFGLAKLVDEAGESFSHVTGFLGTPAYAAPEQVNGGAADTRSDVYALGVVLYEMLAGQHPFDKGVGVAALFDQVRRGAGRAPSSVRPGIGRELDAIVHKAMALEAADRYQSAEALATDLRRFLGGETVVAHPPSAMYRLRKLARRHRAAVGVSVVAAGLLLAFLVLVTVLAVRLSAEQRKLVSALGSEHAALVEAREARAAEATARQDADRAATEAGAAKERAQAEASHSKAGLQFLMRLLEEAGGRRGFEGNVPVRDVLARATAELDAGAMKDQPDIERQLRGAIAMSYRSLGLIEQAEPQARRALELAEQLHGHDSLETASLLGGLARVLEFGGELAEAEACERETLAIRIRLGAGDQPAHAGYMSDLASVLDTEGLYEESLAIYQAALELRITKGARDGGVIGPLYRNIGLEQLELGRYAEAEENTLKAIDLLRRSVRRGTDAHFRAQRNLAQIYSATGRRAQGVSLLRGVIARWSAQIGGSHPQMARERAILARMIAADDLRAAAEMYDESLSVLEERLGAGHPWAVRTRVEMAGALAEAGAWRESGAVARRALEDALASAPGNEAQIGTAARALATAQLAEGRPGEAWLVAVGAVLEMGSRLRPDDPRLQAMLDWCRGLAADTP